MKVHLQTRTGQDVATCEMATGLTAPDVVLYGTAAFRYHITVHGAAVYRECTLGQVRSARQAGELPQLMAA